MADKFVTVGRIIVGAAGGKDREVIQPNTEFDPTECGFDEKEVEKLLASGAIRKVEEPEPAPADGPQPAPTNQPGQTAESGTISREPPPDEPAA